MPYCKKTLDRLKQDPEWLEKCRAQGRESGRKYRASEHGQKYRKEWQRKYGNEATKRWRKKNNEHWKAQRRKRYHNAMQDPKRKSAVRKRCREYTFNRRKIDPDFAEHLRKKNREHYYKDLEHSRKLGRIRKQRRNKKYYSIPQNQLRHNVSGSMYKKLRSKLSNRNNNSTFKQLPYTVDQLMERLESQFKPGMSWENYGKWHVDHIIPDSFFQYGSPKDPGFQKSWALENLQPLWATDNLKKGGIRRTRDKMK